MESKRDDNKTLTKPKTNTKQSAQPKHTLTKQIATGSRIIHNTSYAAAMKTTKTQPKNIQLNTQHPEMTYINEMISQNQKQMLQMFTQMMNTQMN